MSADLRPAWMVEQLMREYALTKKEVEGLMGDEQLEGERKVQMSFPPDPEKDTAPEGDEWRVYHSKQDGTIRIAVGDGPFSPQDAEALADALRAAAAKVRGE